MSFKIICQNYLYKTLAPGNFKIRLKLLKGFDDSSEKNLNLQGEI